MSAVHVTVIWSGVESVRIEVNGETAIEATIEDHSLNAMKAIAEATEVLCSAGGLDFHVEGGPPVQDGA